MSTIIIERKETTVKQEVIPLPYYASEPWCGGVATRYWAITGAWECIQVTVFPTDRMPYIGPVFAQELPADHTRIDEAEFNDAFDTAIGMLHAKRAVACPSFL